MCVLCNPRCVLINSPKSAAVTGGVDSDDGGLSVGNNLNLVSEPGQDLSFPPTGSAGAPPEPFGAPSAALPYILPSEGYIV